MGATRHKSRAPLRSVSLGSRPASSPCRAAAGRAGAPPPRPPDAETTKPKGNQGVGFESRKRLSHAQKRCRVVSAYARSPCFGLRDALADDTHWRPGLPGGVDIPASLAPSDLFHLRYVPCLHTRCAMVKADCVGRGHGSLKGVLIMARLRVQVSGPYATLVPGTPLAIAGKVADATACPFWQLQLEITTVQHKCSAEGTLLQLQLENSHYSVRL